MTDPILPQPTIQEVDNQVRLIFGTRPDVANSERGRLLLFLLEAQRTGKFRPFPPLAKTILFEFFIQDAKTQEYDPPADAYESEEKGKQLAKALRDFLGNYYRDLPPYAPDQVEIQISEGRNTGDEPLISYRKPSTGPLTGEFKHLGDNIAGLKYLTSRIPFAGRIEDTTIRWNQAESVYQGQPLEDFKKALRESDVEFRLIVAPVTNQTYARTIQEAFAGYSERIKCYKLHHTAPIMNFTNLKYKDNSTEVLFGYDENHHLHRSAVVSSTQPDLTKQFRFLFDDLSQPRFSSRISVQSPEFMASELYGCDVLATFPKFPEEEVDRQLESCRRHIKVCVTAWPLMGYRYKSHIKKAMENKRTVQIILWKPGCEFVRLREEALRDTADSVEDQIEANRKTLKTLGDHPNLDKRSCSKPAPVSIFWIDEMIYFGNYWLGKNSSHGPHFMVRESSETGKFLKRQYEEMYTASQVDK